MDGDRRVTTLAQPDQWARCAHQGTSLLPGGGVELTWLDDGAAEACHPSGPPVCEPSGLAFDRWCTAYRSRPELGLVEVASTAPRRSGRCPGVLGRPRGLAVDRRQRLYVAEPGLRGVRVIDLWQRQVLRLVPVGPGRPVDVAADCGQVLALVRRPDRLVRLDGRRGARPGPSLVAPRCVDGLQPTRIASGPLVLWTGHGRGIVARPDGHVEVDVDGATDLDVTPSGVLVVARGGGQPIRRFMASDGTWLELEPVGAPGYDGGAVAITPQGRIAYTVADGWTTTTGAVAHHVSTGSVITCRFDSGAYRTRWGRLFVDACLPTSTDLRVRFLTTDDDDVPDPVPATRPARGNNIVRHADRTPPLPSATQLASAVQAGDGVALYRRPGGAEEPWLVGTDEAVRATYEAPVAAAPGRYLWIVLELTGTDRVTPRVHALRVERRGHPLLDSLPASWSRDDGDADFLQRFLTPLDGLLDDLDRKAAQRAILLDPRSSLPETVSWLASFAGLVLDGRWSDSARRTLVAEAHHLYARRGTRAALLRIVEIYLGRLPTLVEHWQLRGLGGAELGQQPGGPPAPVVGGTASATATLGRFTIGGTRPDNDSYRASAHRFTVLVPGTLTTEQRTVVDSLVRAHRPAHTAFEVCELGSGMRVGQRLRVALTSFVGPQPEWAPAVLGQVTVGGDGVVGTPLVGSRVGGSATVGSVRVG